jgi:hypothetical protein
MVKIILLRSVTLIQRDMTIGLSYRAVLPGVAMCIWGVLVLVVLWVDKSCLLYQLWANV